MLSLNGVKRIRHYFRHVDAIKLGRLQICLEPLEDRLAPATLLHSLFPDSGPQVGAQFGRSVATDTNFQVVGSALSDVGGYADSGQAVVFNATTGALVTNLFNPSPAFSDYFGFSVSVSGSSIVVGAYQDDTGAADSGSAYVFNAMTGALIATLNNPTPASGDGFGFAVAISGNTVVVGASGDNTGATDSGSAYIFNATTGALISTLNNPTPASGDAFGFSVAVSGNTVVVGAIGDNTGAGDAGSAYTFNATNGAFIATLNNPAPASDLFGLVAISGNIVLVGAYEDDAGALNSGTAYVFNATTGALISTLNNPTPAVGDGFGGSVAISGNIAVVGATGDDTGSTDAGSAYIFNATNGVLVFTLNDPTPASGDDRFGIVAVSGNSVLVGAYQDSTEATAAGSAYTFNATNGSLVSTFVIRPTGDNFGVSVAASGNMVVVGAWLDDTGAMDSGIAYVFNASSGALITTLNNPLPGVYDWFGFRVAISGNIAVVGSDLDDTLTTDAGSAYVFNATTGALIATLNNPAPATGDRFGFSLAISGSSVVVGALYDDAGATDSGTAYVFNATTGSLVATLNNPTPAVDDQFGGSASVSGNIAVVGASGDDTGVTNAGAAYVFNASTGALIATLNNPIPASVDYGYPVAISGNTVVVGAHFRNTGATSAGSAYIFNATTGTLIATLNNPFPQVNDQFGFSVAVSGNNVVVGARYDNAGAPDGGSTYVFNGSTGALIATLNNPNPADSDYFGVSVAVSGNMVIIGAEGDDDQNTNQGSAHVFSLTISATQVGPITPDPLNTAVTNVQVLLNGLVDISTFTAADFSLTRNGGGNLLTGAETVTFVSGTTYQINGLAGLTNLAGTYVLTVDMSGVNDLAGNPGVGSASDTWVVDLTPPVATSVAPVVPNPRNTTVAQIDFTFSEPVDLATLTSADLMLTRGGPNLLTGSETIVLVSGSTYRISGLAGLTAADGVYTLTVIGAGVQDLAGNVGGGSPTTSWTMDTIGPQISGVYFDGVVWSPAFRAEAGNTTYGYPAQTAGGQLATLPWSTINTVYIQFSENVNLIGSDLGIRGINLPNYNVASFTYDNLNFVGRWVLNGNIDTDRVILDLDGDSALAVDDLAGNKLAGSWTEGLSTFPTLGAAATDFKYRFVVAVGDADRSGIVRNPDTNHVRANLFIDAGQAGYDIYADIDGNGLTRNADVNAVRSHLFIDPPAGPGPNRPGRGGAARNRDQHAIQTGSHYVASGLVDQVRAGTTLRRMPVRAMVEVLDRLFAEL